MPPVASRSVTSTDTVVHNTEAMHSTLLGSSLDVLQLVLRLHAHTLDLADRLINVWDLSLLRSLHSLGSNLCSRQQINCSTGFGPATCSPWVLPEREYRSPGGKLRMQGTLESMDNVIKRQHSV